MAVTWLFHRSIIYLVSCSVVQMHGGIFSYNFYSTCHMTHYTVLSIHAGVMGSPRTCLHSILGLLDHAPESAGCHYSNPKLAELAYKVIYQLCSSRYLATPTLRYLRSNHDFFNNQLLHLPLRSQGITICTQLSCLIHVCIILRSYIILCTLSLHRQDAY